ISANTICFFLVRLRFLGGSGDSSPHSPLDAGVRLAEDGEVETTTRLTSTTSGSSDAGRATLVSKERHVSVNHRKQKCYQRGRHTCGSLRCRPSVLSIHHF